MEGISKKWDIPAIDFKYEQKFEFYEEDGKSSLSKIEIRDKHGLNFGMTSLNDDVPVAYGAHGSVNVPMSSFPEGGSDQDSP